MKKGVLLLVFLLILPGILAHNHISADYQIIDGSVFAELKLQQIDNLELTLPYNIKTLEVNTDYTLEDYTLLISSGDNIKISYITKSLIDKAGSTYYFVLKNQLTDESNTTVYLPEGAILGDIVFPKDYKITTDGRRIILNWPSTSETEILVEYEFRQDPDWFYLISIIVLIVIIAVVYKHNKRKLSREIKKIKEKSKHKKSKEQKEEDITKNLYEDEKKIVKYLLTKKGNESWTKEIARDLQINKVKLSRKLRSLEAKEVIKRIPYGNENRIRVLK